MANNLQTLNNQFEFNFPAGFVSENIEKRYLPYLKSKRKMHSTVQDFLSSTILDISFPSLNIETTSNDQVKHRKKINWKSVGNIYDYFDKEASITIQNVDSNINYFILLNVLSEKYLDVNSPYDENIIVTVVDENRNGLYNIQFRSVIWKKLSGTDFGFNKQTMGENTFTLSFFYNYMDVQWIEDGRDIITGSIFDDPNVVI